MLNIIKRLDKIIDDYLSNLDSSYNTLDVIVNSYWDSLPKNMQEELKEFYSNKKDESNIVKELSEIQKQLSKPIEIYRNDKWIYDVQPNNPSWTIIESDETNTKPCDTE